MADNSQAPSQGQSAANALDAAATSSATGTTAVNHSDAHCSNRDDTEQRSPVPHGLCTGSVSHDNQSALASDAATSALNTSTVVPPTSLAPQSSDQRAYSSFTSSRNHNLPDIQVSRASLGVLPAAVAEEHLSGSRSLSPTSNSGKPSASQAPTASQSQAPYDFTGLDLNVQQWPFAPTTPSATAALPNLGLGGLGPVPTSIPTTLPGTLSSFGTFGSIGNYPASWDLSSLSQPQQQIKLQQLQQLQLQSLFPFAQPSSVPSAPFPAKSSAAQSNNNSVPRGNGLEGLSAEDIAKLTPAQLDRLKNLKMPPPHLRYQAFQNASTSLGSPGGKESRALSSSDHDATKSSVSNKKRKASQDENDDDDDDDDDDEESGPVKKTAHNMIEKRYRTNLNDKIASLRDSVPSLRIMSKSARGEDTTEDREELHGLTPAHKLNKATVLSKATEYIRHLEKRNNRLIDENLAMQQRIQAFEKLFMAGAINGTLASLPPHLASMQYAAAAAAAAGNDPSKYSPHQMGQSPMPESPAVGMIPVPDDMKRLLQAQMQGPAYPIAPQQFSSQMSGSRQQTVQQQQQQQQIDQGRYQNGNFGKLMVGSLAGLMILEAMKEDEQSTDQPEGRGLSALPFSLLNSAVSKMNIHMMGYAISAQRILSMIKLLLFIGFMVCTVGPSLLDYFRRHEKQIHQMYASTTMTPSTSATKIDPTQKRASTFSVQTQTWKQLWSTSIQNIWLLNPKNRVGVIYAIAAKTIEAFLCFLVGPHYVQMLLWRSDDEEHHIKENWSMAINAQLAGGDDNVDSERLLLSFLSSTTLPETPEILMRKALHVLILCDTIASPSLETLRHLGIRLARSYWEEARLLNQTLLEVREMSADDQDKHAHQLPEHLALLLEYNVEEILTDTIIIKTRERIYSMTTDSSTLESQLSPLDYVASWWSESLLSSTLIRSISMDYENPNAMAELSARLKIARLAAPEGSHIQIQATIARAALINKNPSTHLAAAVRMAQQISRKSPVYEDILADHNAAIHCAAALMLLRRDSDEDKPTFQIPRATVESCAVSSSLLVFVCSLRVMEALVSQTMLSDISRETVEILAGRLRVWIGGKNGGSSGLNDDLRMDIVEKCLQVTKGAVGMEGDSGYGSAGEEEGVDV